MSIFENDQRQRFEIEPIEITDLVELEAFCRTCRDMLPRATNGQGVYLKTPLRLSLVRERLTDNSHVYDINAALILR